MCAATRSTRPERPLAQYIPRSNSTSGQRDRVDRRRRLQIESTLKHNASPFLVLPPRPPSAAPVQHATVQSASPCRLPACWRAMMAGKFEWQFKCRDEGDVNAPARARQRVELQKVPDVTGTSAIRQKSGLPCRFSDNDNHRARWRDALLWLRRRSPSSPATRLRQGFAGACAVLERRSVSERRQVRPGIPETAMRPTRRRGVLDRPVGAAARHREWGKRRRASKHAAPPRLLQGRAATASRSRSAMSGIRNAGNTPASGNEGVGEHVRTKFHVDREAVL